MYVLEKIYIYFFLVYQRIYIYLYILKNSLVCFSRFIVIRVLFAGVFREFHKSSSLIDLFRKLKLDLKIYKTFNQNFNYFFINKYNFSP